MPSTVHKQQNDWPMARKCDQKNQKISLQYSNGQFPKSSLAFLYRSFFLEIFSLLYCAVCTVDYSSRFVSSTVHKQQNDWPMARKCDQKIHLQYPNPAFPSSTVVFFSNIFLLYCTVCTVNYSNRFVPSTVHKQQNDWPMARKCDQKIHLQYSNGQFPKSSLSFLYGSLFLKIFFFLYCAVRTVNYSNRFVPCTVHKQQNDWPMARKCDQKIHLQYSNGQFPKSSLAFLYRSLFYSFEIFSFSVLCSMYCRLFKQICVIYCAQTTKRLANGKKM